jgi:16S rRNA (cytidine1402-2'-O)-methyltransferase
LLETITTICHNETKLCIAVDITLPTESIRTMKVSEWKKKLPSLKDKLVVFVMQ